MATRLRRPTIYDVASEAQVSFKTVSRVLNGNPRVADKLRRRVQRAISELGYQPNLAARSLGGGRSYGIALLVDRSEFFREDDPNAYFSPYMVDLQAGALLACQDAGFSFFVEPYDGGAKDFAKKLAAQLTKKMPEGVLLAPPSSDRADLLAALENIGTPYIRIAPGSDLDRAPSVATDEYEGVVALAEHLLMLGHRRIGMVCGPETHLAAGVRLLAFRDTLRDRADLIFCPGDFTFAGGIAAGDVLCGLRFPPTAIFAANDFMAAGVLAAATRRGLDVPRDISVAGFDDSAIARFVWPPLTTVRQPVKEMARAAVNYLAAAGGSQIATEHWAELPPKLIIRESTGRLTNKIEKFVQEPVTEFLRGRSNGRTA